MDVKIPKGLEEHVDRLSMIKLRLGAALRIQTKGGEVFYVPAPNPAYVLMALDRVVRRRLQLGDP